MNLNDIHRGVHGSRKTKRLGRGVGSGHGRTSTRGNKGQRSRAGWYGHPTFQGGSMPVVRRIAKRGFVNSFATVVVSINVADLENCFENGAEVKVADVAKRKLAALPQSQYRELKVLGEGELTKKLTVHAHRFSAQAREKIEKAGGQCVLAPRRVTVAEKKAAARG